MRTRLTLALLVALTSMLLVPAVSADEVLYGGSDGSSAGTGTTVNKYFTKNVYPTKRVYVTRTVRGKTVFVPVSRAQMQTGPVSNSPQMVKMRANAIATGLVAEEDPSRPLTVNDSRFGGVASVEQATGLAYRGREQAKGWAKAYADGLFRTNSNEHDDLRDQILRFFLWGLAATVVLLLLSNLFHALGHAQHGHQ